MADPTVERAIESLGTVPEAAKKLKVSKSLIYMVLRGEREPSDKLLKGLGLTRLKVITKST